MVSIGGGRIFIWWGNDVLGYDGTVMPQTSMNKTPGPEVISILNTLCGDPKNVVFIVSGRGRESLGKWFSPCEKLGIAAEHGYFFRYLGVSLDHSFFKLY